ncbi:MAG: SusD/RagB family nutrient-binding outer membrane lipoprotein [Reichenbachiella sp.]|uniref:SusD/RagB family nutrient-binding outer membrane lipoprotein n=1 Tax=Reichenbachiella sp. TaxID=2184521 RepID=UPI00326753AF
MKKILSILLVFVIVASCTNEFEDLNTNPNQPSTASENLAPVFRYVQRHAFAETRFNTWRGNLIFGSRFADQWSFSFGGTWFGNAAGFTYDSGWTDAAWDDPYSKVSGNLVALIEGTATGGAAEDVAVNAITRVMKGFFYQRMTDQFGAIPYSEAGTAEPTPIFESQQDVYNDIMADLGTAIADLKTVSGTHGYSSDDLVYAGDISKWIKAANTLRLRMALRAKDAPGSNSASVITAAMAEGEFLSSNDDTFAVDRDLSNAQNLFNGYSDIWYTWGPPAARWVLSNTLVDALKANNDPRLFAYAQPAQGGTVGNAADYVGSVVGGNATYIGAADFTTFSRPNHAIYTDGNIDTSVDESIRATSVMPSLIMTYAEAELLQAEVANDAGDLATAQTHFTNAIRGSMEYWGVDAADIATYLTDPSATLVAGTAFDQIALQRWLAAYTYGYEAWAVSRRMNVAEQLGFDTKPFGGTSNYANTAGGAANVLPKRLQYGTNAVLLNADGVAQGIQMNGGADVMTTKLWWDVN